MAADNGGGVTSPGGTYYPPGTAWPGGTPPWIFDETANQPPVDIQYNPDGTPVDPPPADPQQAYSQANATQGIGDLDMFGKRYNIAAGSAEGFGRDAQGNEMSAWHLQQMLDSNSPLMRQASAMGQAQAGSRGLMNSNMAIGAAHGSMVSHAQPFALQGADAHMQAARESLAAKNQAELNNSQLTTQANIAAGQLTGALDNTALQLQGQSLMNQDQRNWQTDESAAQRDWQGEENQENRDWTSAENIRSNSLAWAQSELQAYASIGMNREQARAQVLADIYGNPNLTASEQRAAAANANRVFDDMEGQPWNPPAGLPQYDPQTGDITQSQPAPAPPDTGGGRGPGNRGPGDGGDEWGGDPYNGRDSFVGGRDSKSGLPRNQLLSDQYYSDLNQRFGQSYSSVAYPSMSTTMDALPPVL